MHCKASLKSFISICRAVFRILRNEHIDRHTIQLQKFVFFSLYEFNFKERKSEVFLFSSGATPYLNKTCLCGSDVRRPQKNVCAC